PEDVEVINSIFRSAHTLKGMAATMGLDTMTKLTHQMENIFELVKNQEVQVSHELITLIFECLDELTDIVEDLQAGGEGELDVSSLIDELIQLSEGKNSQTESKTDQHSELIQSNQELIPQLNTWDSSDLKVINEG